MITLCGSAKILVTLHNVVYRTQGNFDVRKFDKFTFCTSDKLKVDKKLGLVDYRSVKWVAPLKSMDLLT